MKFGVRKPSLKKSIRARTTGKVKRKVKSSLNPLYGKKGIGYIKDPKRAVTNKLYRKTTFGVNPLSSKKTISDKHSSRSFSKNRQAIGYIKKEWVELELDVSNPFERWVRRLLRKKTIETKVIQKNIITEQYTYEEIDRIQEDARQTLIAYNKAIQYVSDSSQPDVFFPKLKEAETALLKITAYTKKYSFLIPEGENVVETYHRFLQEKDNVIKHFVHKHFSHSLKGADSLKTSRGKKNRLLSDYASLSVHFDEVSSSAVSMINSVWGTVIPRKELNDN